MKIIRVFLVFCFLLSIGCQLDPKSTEVILANKGAWLEDFLNQPTCQPPCWEDIIPGETPIYKAREILSENKEIYDISNSVFTSPLSSPSSIQKTIRWYFNGNQDTGRIDSDNDGELVRYITFEMGNAPSLTLGEFLDVYGPPDYLLISLNTHNSRFCSLQFFYDKYLMEIGTDIFVSCKDRTKIPVEENIIIRNIVLEAGIEGEWLADKNQWLQEWQGYDDYQYK